MKIFKVILCVGIICFIVSHIFTLLFLLIGNDYIFHNHLDKYIFYPDAVCVVVMMIGGIPIIAKTMIEVCNYVD